MTDGPRTPEENARLAELFTRAKCTQCGINAAWLTPVCLSCCRKNHRAVMGGRL